MKTSVLNIQASGRQQGSITRELSNEALGALNATEIVNRDLAEGVPFVNEAWIGANFTAANERTDQQRALLEYSDNLVDELEAADVLVIGAPIYNFGVPAVLKAWVDMIARVGRTFNYTENGPVGQLVGKRAIVVIASGGTEVGSEIDFASGYLRHALGFVGISDVTIVAADELGSGSEEKLTKARAELAAL